MIYITLGFRSRLVARHFSSPCSTHEARVVVCWAHTAETRYGFAEASFGLTAAPLVRASFHCFIAFGYRAHSTPFSCGAP